VRLMGWEIWYIAVNIRLVFTTFNPLRMKCNLFYFKDLIHIAQHQSINAVYGKYTVWAKDRIFEC